ncbi:MULTISPECIES: c-type cytochrome [Paenibacillus]|uniref:Cytochrome c n=1 Tax=Paenibacillus azoreducens TaxID=116718 RepID=A0A920CV64_9BACL|nr:MULTISPECIES: cytochrome c [Paenibacillus]MBE9917703.1 cytochrome c [Paenibacillus donghaensis]GIO51084.1 cytochrome c [Paenibacillus azoreducens]
MQKWIMSGLITIACVFAIVLIFTLPGKEEVAEQNKPPAMPEVTMDAAAAEATLKAQGCISCHGDQLQGGAGPNLQKIGSQLSAEEIYKIITKGQGGMPSFKDKLKSEEIANVAQWLAAKK